MPTDSNSINHPTEELDELEASQAEIDACWIEVKTKKKKAMWLFSEGKNEEALQVREQYKYMVEELNSLIKDFLLYKKYKDAVNKGSGKGKVVALSVSKKLKDEKTSNGGIVAEVPKR